MSLFQPQILIKLKEMFSSREDFQKRCDELLEAHHPMIACDGPYMSVKECLTAFKVYVHRGGIVGFGDTYRFPKSQLRPDQIEKLTRLAER